MTTGNDLREMPEHVDVVIIGAGLSGIGAACHLRSECPDRSFAVLEARPVSGGTWDLFRYPGVRSDSDMFTLGYQFQPWTGAQAIADGAAVLRYLRETAREHQVEDRIRYRHRVRHASFSSADARWTLQVDRLDPAGEVVDTIRLTCGFLFANTGYYRYDQGYTPAFAGADDFTGTIVHPQHWPDDLDLTGRRVVVIGSGATAVTLVPALAGVIGAGGHVTMLQRSPSYVASLGARDPVADLFRRRLPKRLAHRLVRWKNVLRMTLVHQVSRRAPRLVRALLRTGVQRQLPPGYDVDTHFSPRYLPWDQRLCVSPDGDLFRAISTGTASVVTDGIDRFTEKGLLLASGTELEADVIVTATGLNLLALGGVTLEVDGEPVDLAGRVSYRGVMLGGIPNLALTLGYTSLSWTLKADLTAGWVCRLLNHMAAHGYRQVTPHGPDPALPTRPFIDLRSGYVLRSVATMPRQGRTAPWRQHQNYLLDVLLLRYRPVTEEHLEFTASNPP